MANKLRFDGRVALVTGAGGGLGREYALAFAERGAKVVVNDLGGDIKGGGKSSKAADAVVEEIRSRGGTAVANYDSVEHGEKLVQTALDNFGRIDILVNNAGILRDRSFARTSDVDWDLIQQVHLRGSFMVTRAAWPHMKENKYGRIIMTTSAAGLYGNFGQANYSAAKMGLVGLGNTLAIEGAKNNIFCNTLAPTAGSRLTQTVMPQEMVDALKPEYVAPLVLYLCHEDTMSNGKIYECGAGYVAQVRWQKSGGAVVRQKDRPMSPEDVRDKWDAITDYSNASNPGSIGETNMILYQILQESGNHGVTINKTAAIEPDKAIGAVMPESSFTYGDKDVILYALGVGVSTRQPDHLKFLFEMNDEFCVLPTFGVIIQFGSQVSLFSGGIPGFVIDPTKILHGEQYMELYKPLPTSGTVKSKAVIADVLDKGKGAVIIIDVTTFDESGEKLAFNQSAIFVQKAGGFGGKRSSDKARPPMDPPKRTPDVSIQEKTDADQAALYRLSGDSNPLHIDPSFAAMGGFPTPILHGLCSFGYAGRHVLKQYCNNNVSKFKAIKVRFSKPVLPGQTIQTDMWKEGSRVFFQCKVAETGDICLSGAYVDLHEGAPGDVASATAANDLKSDALFQDMQKRISGNMDLARKINAVFQFNITKNGKPAQSYTLDLKGKAEAYQGEPKVSKAGCTIIMDDDDFFDMSTGKLNGQKAFLTGKLKVKGNIMLSQKLGTIFQYQSKL